MAEWSIATVLKTVEGHTSGGSNPSLSASNLYVAVTDYICRGYAFIYTPSTMLIPSPSRTGSDRSEKPRSGTKMLAHGEES